MTSLDNTSPSLTINSLSIEYQPFNCVGDAKMWLFAHFIISRCIDTMLVIDAVMVFHVLMCFSCFDTPFFWRFVGRSTFDVLGLDEHRLRRIIFRKELKLVSTYISIAYLYTCLVSSSIVPSISPFTFFRWLIEAAFLPQTLMLYMCASNHNLFAVTKHYCNFYVRTIVAKSFLFVFMRYAEMHSEFVLNDCAVDIFKVSCALREVLLVFSERYS